MLSNKTRVVKDQTLLSWGTDNLNSIFRKDGKETVAYGKVKETTVNLFIVNSRRRSECGGAGDTSSLRGGDIPPGTRLGKHFNTTPSNSLENWRLAAVGKIKMNAPIDARKLTRKQIQNTI